MKGWQSSVPNGAAVRITRAKGAVTIRVGEGRHEGVLVISEGEANVVIEGLVAIMRATDPPGPERPPYPFCSSPEKCIAAGRCMRTVRGEPWSCAD